MGAMPTLESHCPSPIPRLPTYLLVTKIKPTDLIS